jgi:hypothetical protein
MPLRLPKLDKTMPIVGFRLRDAAGKMVEHEAIATPQMQRFWQSAVVKSDTGSDDAATKVSQINAPLYAEPTISNPPTQAEVQALAHAVKLISDALQR